MRSAWTPAKAATGAGAMRHARRCADEGSGRLTAHPACHYPAGEGVWIGAKGVVTGGKIGLRVSRGKDRANRDLRAALVTAS